MEYEGKIKKYDIVDNLIMDKAQEKVMRGITDEKMIYYRLVSYQAEKNFSISKC